MCIFASSVVKVAKTQILVVSLLDGRQMTVYSNLAVSRKPKNAMILPVPVGRVEFVNLQDKPDVFKECEKLFPQPEMLATGDLSFGFGAGFSTKGVLPTERVGAYVCSLVPTLEDFSRIDASVFTLPPTTEELLTKNYPNGYSFVVCQFDKVVSDQPIAYVHEKRADGSLFIPTFHGHEEPEGFQETTGFLLDDDDGFLPLSGKPRFSSGKRGNNDNSNVVVVHEGITCDICRKKPLTGTRYKCMNCADFDACEGCRRKHDPTHVFAEFTQEVDNSSRLWRAPVWEKSVYKNAPKLEMYDHTIFILNGVLEQKEGQYSSLESKMIQFEHYDLTSLFDKLGYQTRLVSIQKLKINGMFPNMDYSAREITMK
jgi:hypothetical protein